MFGRFLKPRWQHANPDIRLKAIEQLSLCDNAILLNQLARGDASALVRAAATGRLTDFAALDEVHQRDEAPSVREAASMRIMALLAGTTDDAPNSDTRLRLIRLTVNEDVLAYVARQSPDMHSRMAAIERLKDEGVLYQLALDAPSEALRVASVQNIASLSLLKRLSKEGRDKRVTRLARDQARVLQQQQQQSERETAKVYHLADRLEQHARRRVDALYGPQLEQLEQQWQQLTLQATPDLASRVQQALHQCRNQLTELQEQTRQQALAETAKAEREAAAHSLFQLLSQATPETWDHQLGEMRSALATQRRRWDSANEQSQALDEDRLAFTDLVAAFEQLLTLAADINATDSPDALTELSDRWPGEYQPPSALLALRTLKAEAADAQAPAQPRPAQPHRGLLVALKRELRQGNLRHANRLWHKAQAIIENHGDRLLDAELAKLAPRRAELQDWHRFAAEPKKITLCESMEALNGATMDAPELATAIQALHDEWRALMSSDQGEDQALWARFKEASDQAYQPCRAHFAELDATKARNLAKRQALCEQLEGFITAQNWETADWHGVWQIRQQAPKDWKALHPIRFTDAREVQKHFSSLLTQLDEQLSGYIEKAEGERKQLLDQARALTELDDAQHATREAQAIQKRWRQSAWLPPGQHRALQKPFRKIMDALFDARNREVAARREQQEEASNVLATHIDALEESLAKPFSNDTASSLRSAASAVDEHLAGNPPQPLMRKAQQLKRRASERLQQLSRWQQWQQLRDAVAALPESTGATAEKESDTQADAALTLAVAFEALAGVPSPEPERQRRLQWQLEQLPSAMKRQQFDAREEMQRLIGEQKAPVSAAVKARMDSAIAVLEPGNA